MTIERREFLKGSVAAAALTLLPGTVMAGPAFAPAPGNWRKFEVTTRIEIAGALQGAVTAWLPLAAISAAGWQRPVEDRWNATGASVTEHRPGPYDAKLIRLAWAPGMTAVAEVRSIVATQDRAVDLSKPGKPVALGAAERALYTAPTRLLPTDGIVKATADAITAGAHSDLEKAKRIFAWVVANSFREAKVRGCGLGDISYMLQTGNLGGKCADLNGLFVGLARASGLPARDLYGIRVAPSGFGYKSLGANSEVISKSQHCRAEVYLSGFGWVPVDPADVRKVLLEEAPGNLGIEDPRVVAARQTLFGAWEGNWIAYNDAHDLVLPGAANSNNPAPNNPAQGFLMYPEAETVAGRLDCLNADSFKYVITAKEITV